MHVNGNFFCNKEIPGPKASLQQLTFEIGGFPLNPQPFRATGFKVTWLVTMEELHTLILLKSNVSRWLRKMNFCISLVPHVEAVVAWVF